MRALVTALMVLIAAPAKAGDAIERLVSRHIETILGDAGGSAVALRIDGRTRFFNYGFADKAKQRPVTPDVLFNLASAGKVFEATLFALALKAGEIRFDDPVAKYIPELTGPDIRRITLGQLAIHTSGLLLRQDYPPWPDEEFTQDEFISMLNAWKAPRAPGAVREYTNAGYVLLQLALSRRFGEQAGALIDRRILAPLAMTSTATPLRPGADPRGTLPDELKARAAQGYTRYGEPIGAPGDVQGYYVWHGTGQMFSSARDMAVFLAANMDEVPAEPALKEAMALAQRNAFTVIPGVEQALAWERLTMDGITVVDKLGGLDDTSTYIGMVPDKKLGLVILSNRGFQDAAEAGRRILRELARQMPEH